MLLKINFCWFFKANEALFYLSVDSKAAFSNADVIGNVVAIKIDFRIPIAP